MYAIRSYYDSNGVALVNLGQRCFADSVLFNCVVETTLPIDANLIGLDPVRLPPDGRVPIYQSADVVVLSHWAEADIGTPSAAQVVSAGRTFLAEVQLLDSLGTALDPAQYTVDLDFVITSYSIHYTKLYDRWGSNTVPRRRKPQP